MSTPTPVEQLVALTEKTKVRLTLASLVAVVAPLLGATAWATTVYTTVSQTHTDVVELRSEMKEWRGSIEMRIRALEHLQGPPIP